MTKKDLVRIIREVVKSEVKKVIASELNEAMNSLESEQEKRMSLTEALEQTKQSQGEEEWPSIDPNTLRAKFAGMQEQGPSTMTDINNRPVKNLAPDLQKALTRNYSDLVKRF